MDDGKDNLISLNKVLIEIEEHVNNSLTPVPDKSRDDFSNTEVAQEYVSPECVFLGAEYVEYVVGENKPFPHGFVWKQSLELVWEFCCTVNNVWVANDGKKLEQVSTVDVLQASNNSSLQNNFVDLITGKTITANYLTNDNRRGLIEESIYVSKPEFTDFQEKIRVMLEMINHQCIETLFQAYEDRCNRLAEANMRPAVVDNNNWYAKNTLNGKPLTQKQIINLKSKCHPDSWKGGGRH